MNANDTAEVIAWLEGLAAFAVDCPESTKADIVDSILDIIDSYGGE